jgi:alpha-beta hydrolase superfamily lysophospholipase
MTQMKTETWSWKSEDGLEMYAQSWEPEKAARAVVCLVHGLGEHCGRYEHVGEVFADAGFALTGFDLRGHGRSGGQRGHFPSLEAVMRDIHHHIELARKRQAGKPTFVYGHSLGGMLTLCYTTYLENDLAGVIATGAALRTPVVEQKGKMALSKALGGLLPRLTIPTGLDPEGLSRDPEVVGGYKQDPLVHDVATLLAARVGIQAIERAFAHANRFPVPLLLAHGGADPITYPRGSQEFAELVSSDCTLKIWEGLFHEIHNEPERAQVLQSLLDWMKAQLKKT